MSSKTVGSSSSLFLAAYAAVLVVFASTSSPRRVGDGGEYVAMALNLVHHGRASFTPGDIADIESRLKSLKSGFEIVRLAAPELRGANGRQHMPHFWLYSAGAVPLVFLAELAGVHVNHAFTTLNVLLLLSAAFVVVRGVGVAIAALVLLSPVVWWVDKAHGDAATFALLSMGVVLLQDRPATAALALGLAAAQNPALALIWPALMLAAVAVRPWSRIAIGVRPRMWIGLGAGFGLVLLHPLYYWWRLGVPTPLLGWTERHLPSPWEMSRFLIDPNIGLFFGFPLFPLAVALAVLVLAIRAPRRLAVPAVWMAGICGVVLLGSFSQTVNANHGGTPGVNRWTLWIVPLAIPALRELVDTGSRRSRIIVNGVAAASAAWSLSLFHPRWPESYTRPSVAAQFLWDRYPALDHPTPEVFGERLTHREPPTLPVATSTCSKVLLFEGRWPAHCSPHESMPARCRRRRRVCYGNRSAAGYSFVESAIPPGLHFIVENHP